MSFELIRERNELRDASGKRVAQLQSELAEAQHQAWQGREALADCERMLGSRQEEIGRLTSAHATESGRSATLETALALGTYCHSILCP